MISHRFPEFPDCLVCAMFSKLFTSADVFLYRLGFKLTSCSSTSAAHRMQLTCTQPPFLKLSSLPCISAFPSPTPLQSTQRLESVWRLILCWKLERSRLEQSASGTREKWSGGGKFWVQWFQLLLRCLRLLSKWTLSDTDW